jgi:hypothetical protein
MKNQQTIVDNKNSQLLRRQYAEKILGTRLLLPIAARQVFGSTLRRGAARTDNRQFWCKHSPNCYESTYPLSTILRIGTTPALHSATTPSFSPIDVILNQP